jgi:hypothetical protein
MKVTDRGSVSVTFSRPADIDRSALRPGDTVTARLVERLNRFEAVITIAGQRVTARFVNGVPLNTGIPLVLTAKTGNSYTFRMLSDSLPGALLDAVKNFIVNADTDPRLFSKIDAQGMNSLLSLNLIFTDPDTVETFNRRRGATALLNRMLAMGFRSADLVYLPYLLSRSPSANFLLTIIYSLTGRKPDFSGSTADEALNNIFEKTDILNSGDKSLLAGDLISMLTCPEADEKIYELAVYDDGCFRPAVVIQDGNAWFFSVDFSALGQVESVIKMVDEKISISIVFTDAERKIFFSENVSELESRLNESRVKIRGISLYSKDDLKSAISELKTVSESEGLFNVRV